MEFKELPENTQKTAEHTLHTVLREIGPNIETESAKKLAKTIKAAFIELHQVNTVDDSGDVTEKLAASLKQFVMTGLLKHPEFEKCTHSFPARVDSKLVVDFSLSLSTPGH